MRPILAIAGTTIGEAIRRKVLLIILLIGVIFLIVAPGLGVLSTRSEDTVLRSMMLGIIQLTSAVIAIVLTVYMIPNEIERRTIYTILSKPVHRWQFLVGKFLGAVGALGLMMALMSLVMIVAYIIQRRDPAAALALLQAPALFFIQMSLLAAVAIFFSTFVAPLVNFFLSGGMFVLGITFNPLVETLQQNPNTNAITKGFVTILGTLLPNFANYQIANPLINPNQTIVNPATYYLNVTAYGIMYIGVLLIAGILIFERREV
ncbi:ABC transporter permease [bacterium]|nr:MAG: ABC transporter permease [bacterium]